MSIDIMHFLKRWKRYVIFPTALLLYILRSQGFLYTSIKPKLSSETLTRVQEKLPNHPYIAWQEKLHSFQTYEQHTNTMLTYTLHPALFDSQRSTGNQLLSGSIHLSTKRQESIATSGTTSFHITLEGLIQGMRDDNIFTNITGTIQVQGLIKNNDVYLMIDEVSIKQAGKKSDTLSLRAVLLQQYKSKRIHMSKQDLPRLSLLSSREITHTIDRNAKQLRLIPSAQGGGWAYTISGDSLSITGDRQSDTDNVLNIQSSPQHITSNISNTHVPGIWNLVIQQNNAYAAQFEGTLQQQIRRSSLSRDIKGEATRPGGIWTDITHTISIKKSPPQKHSLPKQFLEWNNIMRTLSRDE